jgi:hypothetical protein
MSENRTAAATAGEKLDQIIGWTRATFAAVATGVVVLAILGGVAMIEYARLKSAATETANRVQEAAAKIKMEMRKGPAVGR